MAKKERNPDTHRTQWAAQFAVASELCKQGYRVAFTMGNHPVVDLMVRSPAGTEFSVDVKGQKSKSFWQIKRPKRIVTDLYYILAYVPQGKANLFFVMNQEEVQDHKRKYRDRRRVANKRKGKSTTFSRDGLPWGVVEKFKMAAFAARWEPLPA